MTAIKGWEIGGWEVNRVSQEDVAAVGVRGLLSAIQRKTQHEKQFDCLWTFTKVDGVEPTSFFAMSEDCHCCLAGLDDEKKNISTAGTINRGTIRQARRDLAKTLARHRRPCQASNGELATRTPHSVVVLVTFLKALMSSSIYSKILVVDLGIKV